MKLRQLLIFFVGLFALSASRDGAINLLRRKSTEFLPFVARVKRGDRELELIVPWSAPAAKR